MPKLISILTLVYCLSLPVAAVESDGQEFFEKNIRPLLVEHCYKCHSQEAKKVKGSLYLDSKAGWMKGGDTGPALVPGKPDKSLLIKAVGYKDEDLEMPPKYELKAREKELLRDWIKMGAPDPRGDGLVAVKSEIDLDQGREFWAFQPVSKPALPTVKDHKWARSNIDRFLLASLESKGLRPAADAAPEIVIRRVYFDLIGLPPSPEQIDEYLKAPTLETLATIVDRLLASDDFGRRWGRHWLDVARFAESSGGGRSLMFKHAWRYRDYVIDSFNKDKPYDQFIREQLAGDLLESKTREQRNEQLTALGYLILGPTNYEQQDKALLRMDVIDEQLDTIGRGFLGMTMGCARCHDHKFDPIRTEDYYGMAGILGSTDSLVFGNVSGYITNELKVDAAPDPKVADYEKKVADLSEQLAVAEKELEALGGKVVARKGNSKGVDTDKLPGIVLDDSTAKLTGKWMKSTHTAPFIKVGYQHDMGQGKGQKSARFEPRITEGGIYEVRIGYTPGSNRDTRVPVKIDHADGLETVYVNQAIPPPIGGHFVAVGRFRFEADTRPSITISNEGTKNVVIIDGIHLLHEKDFAADAKLTGVSVPDEKKPELKPKKEGTANAGAVKAAQSRVKKLNSQLSALKKKPPKVEKLVAMGVRDGKNPKDGHIHIRGTVRNLGPVVPRSVLAVAQPANAKPLSIADKQSGRLELAKWIASADNPLTARVMVNRIWHHVYGSGIVRTTDNFGSMGERPAHPELLDHLAKKFTDNGWKVKPMIREMILSRAYAMDSKGSAMAAKLDPENQLLQHFNRKRLEAESIRDGILLISGQLDKTAGGLTIKKLAQYDLNYSHANNNRRSVYVPAFRNAMLEIFRTFDVANSNLVIGTRNVSTLPTQSLYLMNSPFVMAQAEHSARVALARSEMSDAERIAWVYRRFLGRGPTDDEETLVKGHLDSMRAGKTDEAAELVAWTSVCHSLFASMDFRYVD